MTEATLEESIIATWAPISEKYFYSRVAGSSYRNTDGTLRRRIIRDCYPGEKLELVREPDNAYDPHAVAICNQDGEQLGYLEARTALEVSRHWSIEEIPLWVCYLVHHNHHPETDKVVGAVILLFRISPQLAAASQAKYEEEQRLEAAEKEARDQLAEAEREARLHQIITEKESKLQMQKTIREERRRTGYWARLKRFFFGAAD